MTDDRTAPLWFTDELNQRGMDLNTEQLNQFELYYRHLVTWNESTNLTAITDRNEVYVKHFYDSLTVSFYVEIGQVQTLADIGSGAGFPSIPLKIAFPHLTLTIVDSLQKRITFLRHLVAELGLSDVECIHGRAEDVARTETHRNRYDVVTARAVARLNVLNEICIPFAKQGGTFVAMKGMKADEEINEAKRSLIALDAELLSHHRFTLPIEEAERHLIVIRKLKETSKRYPRKAGIPFRKPII